MALGKVLDMRSDGRRQIMLYDFMTNHTELGINHRRFLDGFAAEAHNASVEWKIVGMASRLGERTRTGRDHNLELSKLRALHVEQYLLARNIVANASPRGGLTMPTINARAVGVGTRFSSDTDINYEYDRSVVIWNGVGIPDFRIEAEVPEQATRNFYIKYVGSGAGGPFVLSGSYAQFVIRDERNYWQRYCTAVSTQAAARPSLGAQVFHRVRAGWHSELRRPPGQIPSRAGLRWSMVARKPDRRAFRCSF